MQPFGCILVFLPIPFGGIFVAFLVAVLIQAAIESPPFGFYKSVL